MKINTTVYYTMVIYYIVLIILRYIILLYDVAVWCVYIYITRKHRCSPKSARTFADSPGILGFVVWKKL